MRLNLVEGLPQSTRSEWLTRALLSQFGIWKRNETPPPLWLIHASLIAGSLHDNPQVWTLLLRRLRGQPIPSVARRIQTYDRTTDPGWDYFLYRFLESGGLEKQEFRRRLEQFWANGYDWTQLNLFFLPRYADLNAAELELLWRTFLADTFSSEPAVIMSEIESAEALVSISKIEVLRNLNPEILTPETWYLYRNDFHLLDWIYQKQSELEVIAFSIHPYYFNACHSLGLVLDSTLTGDLNGYREAVGQWNQDMLDAQQLSFETDRLLEKICP